ncbi:MAG: hypothetical protein PHC43_01105 [Candidatus Marinimicrobia bacterium]|nr:hypothetical protein [Candidatus Neomarinimicrobiota bacterium]
MGIINKIRGTIVHDVFEFTSGATFKSTANDTIITSSGLTATSTFTATAKAVFSSAVSFAGTVTVSSGISFPLPVVSTLAAPAAIGLFGFSTANNPVVSKSTTAWAIITAAS